MNQPDKESELRILPVSVTQQLAKLLDGDDSILSLLMGSVVKDLDNPSSELRFTSNDIELIRNHSQEIRKSPIMIFLDEWSTMGKNRPKLRHLLTLLIKCHLFRAADYLANYLGEQQPKRPQNGPAARVEIDIDIPDEIVDVVNGFNYPFSGSEINRNQPRTKPEIVAPNMNFASENSENGNISLPLIPVPSNPYKTSSIFNGPSTANVSPSLSNLMQFSTNMSLRQVSSPAANAVTPSEPFIPAFSALQVSTQIPMTINPEQTNAHDENIPAFSGLMINGNSTNPSSELPAVLKSLEIPKEPQIENSNIPMLSDLISGESSLPNRSQISTQSTISSSDSD
jgi:Tube Death domain